jgi:hypothetical protein
MTPIDTATVLTHYMGRHIARLGRMPRKRDLDPALVNGLIQSAGNAEAAVHVLDAWFDSPDAWYEREGFALATLCGVAMSRLSALGEIEPAGGMTPEAQLARKLAVAVFLEPELRVVRLEKSGPSVLRFCRPQGRDGQQERVEE